MEVEAGAPRQFTERARSAVDILQAVRPVEEDTLNLKKGGSMGTRAAALLTAAVLGAIAVLTGVEVSAHNPTGTPVTQPGSADV